LPLGGFRVCRKNTAERSEAGAVGTAMGWSMNTQHVKPWPAIDVAELRYGLAFGSSVEEIADFLHRDVDDVRHKIAVEAQRTRHTETVR
jgi:hypothetical protein